MMSQTGHKTGHSSKVETGHNSTPPTGDNSPCTTATARSWRVTFATVTPESAEAGDYDSHGWLDCYGFRCAVEDPPEGMSLREALEVWDGAGCFAEADSYPFPPHRRYSHARWFTVHDGAAMDGETESRSLHIPEGVTASSRMRLARALRVYGATGFRLEG